MKVDYVLTPQSNWLSGHEEQEGQKNPKENLKRGSLLATVYSIQLATDTRLSGGAPLLQSSGGGTNAGQDK